jgi:YD repeat-containing protein
MSLPSPSQSLAYDLDGNLTDDGVWLYTWDGENRLKSMEHKDYGGSASKLYYKLTFDYDSQSRRIRKQVQTKTTFGGA